ncbi:DUF4123 domain-containing protein [Stenotrophomonas sp. 24(2023)]|uniref:DUF4123 domain-containing protein n=1 Tax=Stenotrophomonas sp. 24(2023) TaxID=3068324 RepID=UPI0027DF8F6A|nr:DUF4123 domain-containing protein [Stenotrophomonas sp. 24(2023)]WMJ69540.1 DUF4123 domain-containing protein [Stenotrophomonas sp. 24(2023)]
MSRYDGRFDVLMALRDLVSGSDQPWFVLIDPMSRTDLSCIERFNRQRYRVDLTRYGIDESLCPYVVEILGSRDEFLEETVSLAWERRQDWQEPQPVCGWLCSNRSPAAVALSIKHLAVSQLEGGRWNLRRFYDPRVVRHASFSNCPVRVPGGWERWIQLGLDGILYPIPGGVPGVKNDGLSESDVIHERWAIPTIAAMAQLQRFGEMTPAHEVQLQSAVRCGMTLGFPPESSADAASFLLHKVLIHPEIERHPTIRAWLDQAALGGSSYADRSAEAPSGWWNDVKSGRWTVELKDESREMQHG